MYFWSAGPPDWECAGISVRSVSARVSCWVRVRSLHCSTLGKRREGLGERFLHRKSHALAGCVKGETVRRREACVTGGEDAGAAIGKSDARIVSVRHRSHATHSRQPRQIRKEATVTGSCVCSEFPVSGFYFYLFSTPTLGSLCTSDYRFLHSFYQSFRKNCFPGIN